ncbi:TonB-dependent receptor [Niastella populi]|uniref:TonB-dependent receptor n=1 Tax=Niastella populi TaxID=550983 RepID=A0A1V9GDD6_9BACT|nr:TonB-dependent receptor [Niastella populi]OQP68552.1 TonB-dependent receptor [Niastella populi]
MKPVNAILTFIYTLVGLIGYSQQNLTAGNQPVPVIAPQPGVFSGKITDAKTGEILPGASIYIHDLKKGTISNDKGEFRIGNLNAGNYLVEITYRGYSSIIENIRINGDTQKDFALKEAVVENEEVTVTGVSSATRIRQSPQPVDVLKKEQLFNVSSTNAIDALSKTVPGVSGLSTGPAITKPFIRGLGYNRVVTINDGVRQEGQQWGDEHGIEIDDYSMQRVEVLKGPASLMYGSDALAGVINIISQRPVAEGHITANVLGEYQTNNALRGFYGDVAGTKNGFSWNAYGSYKGAQDYKNKYDGRVFNSKFYNQNFGGMLGYSGAWGYSHVLISNFGQRIGMVEGERDSATGAFLKALPGGDEGIASNEDFKKITPEVPFQHIKHFKIASDNNFAAGKGSIDVQAGYQQNQRQEFGNPDDAATPDAWFDLKTVNYAVRWHLPSTQHWKTTLGVNGMSQTNTNKGEEVIIPDYDLFDIGGFVFTHYHKNKISLSGGLRFDTRHVNGKAMDIDNELKFAGFSRNFSNVSGSVGLSYAASDLVTLKLNVARGFRAPNLAELASNGAHEGTNRFELGDNKLKSETSLQVDGGFELNSEHLSLETSLFYNRIQDFIFYEKVLNDAGEDSIQIDDETGDELRVYRFDQKDANLYGVELALDIHPHPLDWLHFRNAFSYTRARFTEAVDGTKNIPFIPAARLFTDLAVSLMPKGKTLRNLHINLESDYTFKQDDPFTGFDTETATPGYWLINAGIGADFVQKGKTRFSLRFTAYNLGDVAYQNHLSRLKYAAVNNVTGRTGVFSMGRNFGIKLNIPLVWSM